MDRQSLYYLIWSKPFNSVAADFETTSPILRQVCMDNKIPIPWQGYKPKRDDDRRVPLPINTQEHNFNIAAAIKNAQATLLYDGESESTFIVQKHLVEPDKIIIEAQKSLRSDFQLYGMDEMVRTDFDRLTIRSSKNNLDRAIRIMNTLVKIWYGRGYRVTPQDKETLIYVREVSFTVGLRELTKVLHEKDNYGMRRFESTGQLCFKVNGWLEKEWHDGKIPLESRVKEIVDHMEVAARDLERIWADNKTRQEEEAKQEQIRINQIQNDKRESEAFETLVREAQRWNELNILDKYLDEISRHTSSSPAFKQWISWARNRRKLFDPIIKRRSLNEN